MGEENHSSTLAEKQQYANRKLAVLKTLGKNMQDSQNVSEAAEGNKRPTAASANVPFASKIEGRK